MSYTKTEENYLKAIFSLYSKENKEVSTNMIAEKLETKPSSVTDMVKKLANKNLVKYEKYKGATLTKKGNNIALNVIRNHRIWEVFLVEKLGYKWDEVHDMAEQLEHIKSDELIDRMDVFLDNPKFDPHGDPIPDKSGKITERKKAVLLGELDIKEKGIIVGVKNTSNDFLQYLEEKTLTLGMEIMVTKEFEFDKSRNLIVNKKEITISKEVCNNIIIEKQ
ncbi:metal-dependent transcriptional regulator [Flavobacteriales bacterium]|nr:metal-dependent transcriptional regulator [Flavobacteriales bacterium]